MKTLIISIALLLLSFGAAYGADQTTGAIGDCFTGTSVAAFTFSIFTFINYIILINEK